MRQRGTPLWGVPRLMLSPSDLLLGEPRWQTYDSSFCSVNCWTSCTYC